MPGRKRVAIRNRGHYAGVVQDFIHDRLTHCCGSSFLASVTGEHGVCPPTYVITQPFDSTPVTVSLHNLTPTSNRVILEKFWRHATGYVYA